MPGDWRTDFSSQFSPSTMGSGNQTEVLGLHSDLVTHLLASNNSTMFSVFVCSPWAF